MSFATVSRAVFRSAHLPLLERAAAALGLTLDREATTYRSDDGMRPCDMVLRDAHCSREIGLHLRQDLESGEAYFEAEWDWYHVEQLPGGLELQARVGKDLGLLGYEYQRLAVPEQLRTFYGNGSYTEHVREDGAVDFDFTFTPDEELQASYA